MQKSPHWSFRGVDLSDEDLISALRVLSSLTTLEISDHGTIPFNSPITSHFISSLHIGDSMLGHLIPKLRDLTLESDCSTFDDVAFISMISSRWYSHPQKFIGTVGGVDCLQSVVMRFHNRAVDKTVYRPLQDLDEMGLRVVVREMNGGAFQYQVDRGWFELIGNT
ncbi:hypothetical protein BT96DRAFT_990529 [Gymnopus androsaceus JB14]|uniref:F-box domain-containing protein n=1 Tax=Gymnopus androsaceus JB14 TaxID=1447944 RepID=A0A6A4HZ65_9AGAR|nr:hypothetical protein BT96DRAFT_990529 [Gymnopus androsaceus JB14]